MKKRRFLALFLTLCMVLGILPALPVITASAQGLPLDSWPVSIDAPRYAVPGQWADITMTFRNTGEDPWTSSGIELRALGDSGITFADIPVAGTVNSNQTAAFRLAPPTDPNLSGFTVPATPGSYTIKVQLYDTGGTGFFGEIMEHTVVVLENGLVSGITPGSGDRLSIITIKHPHVLGFEQESFFYVTVLNTGSTTWTAAEGYGLSFDRPPWGYNNTMLALRDPDVMATKRQLVSRDVAPGEMYTFAVQIRGTNAAGNHDDPAHPNYPYIMPLFMMKGDTLISGWSAYPGFDGHWLPATSVDGRIENAGNYAPNFWFRGLAPNTLTNFPPPPKPPVEPYDGIIHVYNLAEFTSTLSSTKIRYDYHKLATALQGLVNRSVGGGVYPSPQRWRITPRLKHLMSCFTSYS